MWFKVLGAVIAVALLSKATIALAAPRYFYAARRRQYSAVSVPRKLFVGPCLVVAHAIAAWYATLFHYRPSGWIVTGFLTLLAILSVDHLFRWRRHRRVMLKVVSSSKVWHVDCLLMALGFGFAALAVAVY